MNMLTIGVTGHRKLAPAQLPEIEARARAFYQKQIYRCGPENITVLSSIAEGADNLCAKLAQDMGLRLVAPLPMPEDEYKRDFSGEAKNDFALLQILAKDVFVVPPQEPIPELPSRGFWYRQAGLYVARNCDVLLALWDGVEMNTPDGAGTWETIKVAKAMGREVKHIHVWREG